MRLRLPLVLLAALAAAALTACDAAPPSTPAPPLPGDTPRQVTVVGSGEVQGTPDTLTASVGISFVGTDATTAMNQTNERMGAVNTALVDAGIDQNDIATTNVTLQPQYGTDGVSTVVGYESSNSIDVTIRDISVAGRVLALIQSNGGNATRINSLSYSFADDSELVRDARTRAFRDAEARAQQYAELSGLELGKIISISEAGGGAPPPSPMPMERAMASAVPLSPGQQTVGFSVTAVWELR
ncbi:SIMPL domain-containing protein [soil metagenome]